MTKKQIATGVVVVAVLAALVIWLRRRAAAMNPAILPASALPSDTVRGAIGTILDKGADALLDKLFPPPVTGTNGPQFSVIARPTTTTPPYVPQINKLTGLFGMKLL
jgi:hypothetical protein